MVDRDDQLDLAATPTVNLFSSTGSSDEADEDLIENRCVDAVSMLAGPFGSTMDRLRLQFEVGALTASTTDCKEGAEDAKHNIECGSLDALAARLLKERFILTALELHMELIESGRELSRLRDFFSNPANFERTRLVGAENSPPRTLARTSSVQTFDSLDFARYSDDGDRNENDRVAVLEFEIRKAQDTIKSLRDALTRSTERDHLSHLEGYVVDEVTSERKVRHPEMSGNSTDKLYVSDEPMKPHERRTINFLVNEHLLRYNYKLTSVTFSEENAEQDFDDWDDVGINVAKPPDLLRLYRDYGQHQLCVVDKRDAQCETDWNDLVITKENEQVRKDECHVEQQLDSDYTRQLADDTDQMISSSSTVDSCSSDDNSTRRKSSASTIVGDDNSKVNKLLVSECAHSDRLEWDRENHSSVDFSESNNDISHENDCCMEVNRNLPQNSATTKLSCNEETVHPIMEHSSQPQYSVNTESIQATTRSTPVSFQQALLAAALRNGSATEQQLYLTTDESGVVQELGRCLPRVIPNVLLARRDELIPLLVLAATLHPDALVRDALLHELFNLIKRPDTNQRRAILAGCVIFSKYAGPARVSSELLPQCWEQIEHKYAERRLLVAEACGALAPYIPNDMRGSLVLSILQQMLDDKMEDVREAVIRSLGALVGWIDDVEKYLTTSGILKMCISYSQERSADAVLNVLLPSVAMWSMELGKLESHLIQMFIENIEKLLKTGVMMNSSADGLTVGSSQSCVVADVKRFELYVRTVQQLVPFLFVSVISTGPFSGTAESFEHLPHDLMSLRPQPTSDLLQLSIIVGSQERLVMLITAYEKFISEEWYELWEAFSWTSAEFISRLLEMTTQLDPIEPIVRPISRLFNAICRMFGQTFTSTKILPRFHQALGICSSDGMSLKITAPACPALLRSTAPVFVIGVLSSICLVESERQNLQMFLSEFLRVMAASARRGDNVFRDSSDPMSLRGVAGSDLCSLSASFTGLCALDVHYHEMVMKILWDAVMDFTPVLRATAGHLLDCVLRGGGLSEQIIASRAVPALVTLASDADISVRVSAVPGFGTVVESVSDRSTLEKVYMQFQTFMDDPVYRSTGEQYSLYIEIIRTFGRIGPNTEPRFRDEFILPRLTALAAENQQTTNDRRKAAVALELFETFSALSCCFISDQLMQEVMLPGLRCLVQDLQQVAPDHVNVASSMIKEFENKVTTRTECTNQQKDGEPGGMASAASSDVSTGDAVKAKMLNRIRDVKDRASHSHLSKMFSTGKK